MLNLKTVTLLFISFLFSTYAFSENLENTHDSRQIETINNEELSTSKDLTVLDINSASADRIATLMKGVGAQKAQAIVAFRESNGKFMSIEELAEVKGIGAATVERNKSVILIR